MNAESVVFHRYRFHDFGYPDGDDEEYEHAGDEGLDFGDMRLKTVLTFVMPDKTKFEVDLVFSSHKDIWVPRY